MRRLAQGRNSAQHSGFVRDFAAERAHQLLGNHNILARACLAQLRLLSIRSFTLNLQQLASSNVDVVGLSRLKITEMRSSDTLSIGDSLKQAEYVR